MAIFKCNSCSATIDTDATAKSLGYSPGTKISFTAPSKCGICGSNNISIVSPYTPTPQVKKRIPPVKKRRGLKIFLVIIIIIILFLFFFIPQYVKHVGYSHDPSVAYGGYLIDKEHNENLK